MTPDHMAAAVRLSEQLAEARAQAAAGRAAHLRSLQLRAALAPEIWDAYHLEGRTSPQIAARLIGVSHDTVRRIVGSRAKPTPRPAPPASVPPA